MNERFDMKVQFLNNTLRYNFNFKSSNDEYVTIPLIWDDQEDQFINTTQRSSANSNQPNLNSETTGAKASKFSKFKKTAAIIGGGAVAAPTVVSSTIKSYSDAIKDSKEAIKDTMNDIREIKEHAKEIFRKESGNQLDSSDDKQLSNVPQENMRPDDTNVLVNQDMVNDCDEDTSVETETTDDVDENELAEDSDSTDDIDFSEEVAF